MRRDDEEDDDDDDSREAIKKRSPQFPIIVVLSGVIWIGVGLLALLIAIYVGERIENQRANGKDQDTSMIVPGFSALFGIAFLVCGFQTASGKASDTRGNGIGSIVFGLLQTLAGLSMAVNDAKATGVGAMISYLIVIALGLSLILAGVLALIGRGAYREWLDAKSPRKRRKGSRRRRDEEDEEEEEEDDRKRRRRRR